jgi:hypothetical protein
VVRRVHIPLHLLVYDGIVVLWSRCILPAGSRRRRSENRVCEGESYLLRAPVGIGTAINVVAVLVGGGIGTLLGAKIP